MIKMKKLVAQALIAGLCFGGDALASKERNYFIKISGDNNLSYSQDAGANLAFSTISGLAYYADTANLNDSFLARAALGYGAFFTVLMNHEIVGHGFKAKEMGYDFTDIELSIFGGAAYYKKTAKNVVHIHKNAMVSLNGNQVNNFLAQKIADNVVTNKQLLDPVTGFGYIFSSGNQLKYIYMTSTSLEGHDLVSYSRDMELAYGAGAMSMSKIKAVGFLEFLNPILIASIYSAATGEYVDIPKLPLGDYLAVTPFAGVTLAPYGIIEKKIGTYIFTDYSPVQISFGFGTQDKSKHAAKLTIYEMRYFYNDRVRGVMFDQDHKSGIFSEAASAAYKGIPENYSSYMLAFKVYNLLSLGDVNLSLDGAVWSQPELITDNAYDAKPQTGWMMNLGVNYAISEQFTLNLKGGYKTKGFVIGEVLKAGATASAGFQMKL
jgi:hypothetical protein